MIKIDFLVKLSSLWFFYRWHPEVALRYLPIVDEIKKIKGEPKILEVGSGGLGIAPYLKREVVGVDTHFRPPFYPLLKRKVASALELPFENSSFDVVVSVDMLEHLFASKRDKAIEEMLRVARKKLLIAVPCGEKSYQQDIFLNKYYQESRGASYHFLDEQVKFGLPQKKDISDTILKVAAKQGKKVKLTLKDNENLALRMFLMKGWMTKNFLIDIFFRKILLLAIPVMRRMNQEPVYRRLFFVDIV